MKIIGVGQINVWDGGSLWIGKAMAAVEPHAHHAIQVGIGLKGKVKFRWSGATEWTEFDAAFVPPHLPHAFEATGSTVANVFCEPDSTLGRKLIARFGREAVAGIPADEVSRVKERLAAAYAAGAPDEVLNEAAVGLLHELAASPTVPVLTDPRVSRAIAEINARLDEPIALEDIAESVHLSPSRFRHLFVSETGMPFRPYVLWTRLQKALRLAVEGESWTEAAHAANFADSAHLSRTFRKMFGIAPTSIGRAQPEAGRAGLTERQGH